MIITYDKNGNIINCLENLNNYHDQDGIYKLFIDIDENIENISNIYCVIDDMLIKKSDRETIINKRGVLDAKSKRDELLIESDWTMLEDSPLDNLEKTRWKKYRKTLRDLDYRSDPFNIIWPTPP